MQPIYKHQQIGKFMLFLLVLPIVGLVAAIGSVAQLPASGSILEILFSPSSPAPLAFLLIVIIMIGTIFMFYALTVEVDGERVLLYFGIGFPRRSFPLDQITGVRAVRNTPLMGIGIHFIRGGMIYNISGLDGVEITLLDGSLARIGTDEPDALVRAIQKAKGLF